jgi:PhzF family phenazine biosynthesis protein
LKLPIFQVDAFTDKLFAGNPAAVCPLESWLPDAQLQNIAAENNLSETAFFVAEGDDFKLRWFTPQFEVDLCGHATLATGYVLLKITEPKRNMVSFKTRSGVLTVSRNGDLLAMDFPSIPPWEAEKVPANLQLGLSGNGQSGKLPVIFQTAVFQTKNNYFVIYENEEQVREVSPDFERLSTLHPFGVCITARGTKSDFVSRYFVPSYGILEDPVTGSTHSSLTPYWATIFKKNNFHARQLSKREGDLWCELNKDRVILKGNAVLYLTGTLSI